MTFRSRRVIIAGVAASAVAAGGIAYASIPASTGVISGCYSTSTGALRVIDTATTTSCNSGESSLNWNQRGQTGPTGPRGPQGPQGPAYFARVLTTDNNTYKPSSITIKSWDYSDGTVWLNVPDRDVRQCAATATSVSGSAGATAVRQAVSYSDWILFYTYAGTTRQQMALDVVLACPY
jgi:hypothetical protein